MNKLIFSILLIGSAINLSAQQPSIAYFPFNNTLSITTNPERLIVVDGRIETNTFFGNINPEIFGLINIKRTKLLNVYSGLSCKTVFIDGFNDGNFIGGYSALLGSRYKPFEKLNNLHILFELSPYFNKDFDSGTMRAYLGVSYHFKKREQ